MITTKTDIMKRILLYLASALAILMNLSCNKDIPEEDVKKDESEGGFKIEIIDLHASRCKVRVTPDDLEKSYFLGVATEEYLSTFGSLDDMQTTATNFIETTILENSDTPIADLMKKGIYEREVTGLRPNQKFVVFACHTDNTGAIVSEVEVLTETTPEVTDSQNAFDIEIDQITATSAMLFITPQNDDDYIWMEFPEYVYKKDGKDMSEDELKNLLVNYKPFFPLHTNNGEMIHSFDDKLDPDTEYMIVVFGYDGDFTTPLTTKKFRTLEPGDPSDVTFDFAYADLSPRSVTVTIKPSDQSVSYLAIVVDEETLLRRGGTNAEGVKKLIDNEIALAIAFGEFKDRASFVKDNAQHGERTGTFGLEPGMKHYACAVCMDKDGNYASEVAIDEFTAPQERETNASVTATFDKYFDGDALAASDSGKYGDYSGCAVLPVRFDLKDGALDGIYTVFTKAEIEEADPTDDMIRSILLDNDYMGVSNFFTSIREEILLDWDCEYVIYMIGIDADENVGDLVRVDVPALTKEGASPISEF